MITSAIAAVVVQGLFKEAEELVIAAKHSYSVYSIARRPQQQKSDTTAEHTIVVGGASLSAAGAECNEFAAASLSCARCHLHEYLFCALSAV